MIIYVTLATEAFEHQNLPIIERFLHEIVDIYIKGKHLIVIERHTIDKIRSAVALSRPSEVVLNDLYAHYSQTKNLATTSPVLLEVTNIDDDLSRNGTIYRTGVKKFIEYDLSRETKLLVEHKLNDGDFLTAALQRLATRYRLGKLTFEVGHGGGDDMPALFESEIASKRTTVCVADSDKKYPGAAASEKCKKLGKAVRKNVNSIAHYLELPCHEAENMIPLDVLFELQNGADQKTTLTRLREIEQSEQAAAIPAQERLKLYFDFKCGVSPESFATMRSTHHKGFIQKKFDLIGVDLTRDVVHGIGDHLTRRVSENGKAMAEFSQVMFTCPYWRDVFSGIMKNLLYFLMGGQKRAAI